jgi:16S rRNA G966 N2-methylase RsmD
MSIRTETKYYTNGTVQSRYYYNTSNELHCADGPAAEWFHEEGTIKCRKWYIPTNQIRNIGSIKRGTIKVIFIDPPFNIYIA